jgi:5'-phosphate synthase pdxT subunit
VERRSGSPAPLCGVLALQGSFSCHRASLDRLGVASREVRRPEELADLTHLIIPGGESTTLYRLGALYGLVESVRGAIHDGLAVFGTCAGAILLGMGPEPPPRLGAVPATVIRNAYGRQKESFAADLSIDFVGHPVRGVFIRAPKIALLPDPDPAIEILACLGTDPVLVRYRRILLSTFHPELAEDDSIHRYFLSI